MNTNIMNELGFIDDLINKFIFNKDKSDEQNEKDSIGSDFSVLNKYSKNNCYKRTRKSSYSNFKINKFKTIIKRKRRQECKKN